MLTTHKIRVGPGARQMSSQGVKQSQANEGADSEARGQDGISWALQIIVGDPEGFR